MLCATYPVAGLRHHHHRLLPHCSGTSSSFPHPLGFPNMVSRISKSRLLSFTLNGSPPVAATVSSSSTTSRNRSTFGRYGSFSWEDVFEISHSPDASPGLAGYFEKISLCNRGMEERSEFIPFVIENQVIGYVHYGFVENLRKFKDVFTCIKDDAYGSQLGHVTLHSKLKAAECRTDAIGHVVKSLGEEVFPGIRNELYPVTSSFGTPVHFSLERAAAPYFGIKAYGVHMNGYVEREGEKYLWLGKRSELKPTYPGMLDHLVAGGLPHGISCEENLVKECEEEAGIPSSISNKAVPVGAVSYLDIDGHRFKRDVLFCYDLKLPEGFTPKNQDGEVGSFKLLPVKLVADVIRHTQYFKANCNLVIIDFLFRHGYIKPEDLGYLKLLQSLRSGDTS